MATPPPEQQPRTSYSYTTGDVMARMPVPGNSELIVYLLATLFLVILWALSDRFDITGFVPVFTALTFAYLISRGIAKASRVLEP